VNRRLGENNTAKMTEHLVDLETGSKSYYVRTELGGCSFKYRKGARRTLKNGQRITSRVLDEAVQTYLTKQEDLAKVGT